MNAKESSNVLQSTSAELIILRKFSKETNHHGARHIIAFVDTFTTPDESVVFILELLGQDLGRVVNAAHDATLPLYVVKQIAKQLLQALDYLHSEHGIVHCG